MIENPTFPVIIFDDKLKWNFPPRINTVNLSTPRGDNPFDRLNVSLYQPYEEHHSGYIKPTLPRDPAWAGNNQTISEDLRIYTQSNFLTLAPQNKTDTFITRQINPQYYGMN